MLIELDDLKRALSITAEDDDVLLYDILRRSWAKAELYCDRDFDSAEETEYYKGSGASELRVDRYPVTSLGDVYIDSERSFGGDTLIDSEDLYISDRVEGLITYKDNIFTASEYENVKITYTAGYTATTLPEDLREAVLDLSISRYIKLKGAINAVEGEDDRHKQLEDSAYKVLDKYKRVR